MAGTSGQGETYGKKADYKAFWPRQFGHPQPTYSATARFTQMHVYAGRRDAYAAKDLYTARV